MEMKRLSMWKGSPEMNSRGELAWLLTFCTASTKYVITFYWEVQWTCTFLHGNDEFKTVPWSTQAAPELSGFKSYKQIIMQVRTCPNWLSELIRPNLSELNLLVHPWFELIHLVLLLCFLSMYSCTTPLTYIPLVVVFLSRLCVIGPWFVFIGVLSSSTCVTLGKSTSSCPWWKGVVLDSSSPKNEKGRRHWNLY
jgi:hypothetical protein